MEEKRKPTSMTVRNMGRLLGLGKTESHYLIKKNYFDTIQVAGKTRVMVASFEHWYANQNRYRKIDGTPPGSELREYSYSIAELAELLGLKESTVYGLIAKGYFDKVETLGKCHITKESFNRWYDSQDTYLTVDDREKYRDVLDSTYSLPEVRQMLGIHRNQVYYFVDHGKFDVVMFRNTKRITKESFHRWLNSQTKHKIKVTDAGAEGS